MRNLREENNFVVCFFSALEILCGLVFVFLQVDESLIDIPYLKYFCISRI